MSIVNISISPEHIIPNADLFVALRELIANARDEEVRGYRMDIEFVYRVRDKKKVGAVVFSNEGTTIPRQALLVGWSDKRQTNGLIGRHGEGFKIALATLLRLKAYDIKIRNGSETWNPFIEYHEDFKDNILKVDIREGNKFENRVQIEVLGVLESDWERMRKNFLWLCPPQKCIQIADGRILLDPELRGKIFVKGMYICFDSALQFGYDAQEAELDRERRMVENPRALTANMLTQALNCNYLSDEIYSLLSSQSVEVSDMYAYSFHDEAKKSIVARFHTQYGMEAIPVASEDEVVKLGHFGIRGVKTPYRLRTILETVLPSASKKMDELKHSVQHAFMLDELNQGESLVFASAYRYLRQALAQTARDVSLADRITVVEFADPNLQGTFLPEDRSVNLARRNLGKVSRCLSIMIHEAAHDSGDDGTKMHESAERELMEAVISQMLEET